MLHCFLNDNEDWLKFRLYALVAPEESAAEEKEVLARWKGYLPMSSVNIESMPETKSADIQSDREIFLSERSSK